MPNCFSRAAIGLWSAILLSGIFACHRPSSEAALLKAIQSMPIKEVTLRPDLFQGKWSIVALGYASCPDICPVTLTKFKNILESLPSDQTQVQAIFVTIDPQRDTEERLAKFTGYFSKQIIPVRFEEGELSSLSLMLGAGYGRTAATGTYFHSQKFFVVNPKGQRVGYLAESDVDGPQTISIWQSMAANTISKSHVAY